MLHSAVVNGSCCRGYGTACRTGSFCRNIDIYDVVQNRWSVAYMRQARWYHAVAAIGPKLIINGGVGSGALLTEVITFCSPGTAFNSTTLKCSTCSKGRIAAVTGTSACLS